VVGNLSVGGTGKTPVVMALAQHLLDSGFKPAVISRGYGGHVGRGPEQVEPPVDPSHVGDEPALIASALDVPVWVGSRRRWALEAAVAAGADVVIADDGLQHRQLPRSFELVVVDGLRGFGNGRLLPAGPLRCPIQRLAEADRVLLRGPCTGPDLPAGIPFRLKPLALRDLTGKQPQPPDSLAGQSVSAVCGIGHPEQFAGQLEALGMQVELHAFPDHHRYACADLLKLPRPIVTTAKDAIKLRRLEPVPAGIHVLDVAAELPLALLQDLVEHVREFQA
ncbi:MAG: tetraacyldisaccharide 4'-kinase, partial [Wenzhouxiangella sp.]